MENENLNIPNNLNVYCCKDCGFKYLTQINASIPCVHCGGELILKDDINYRLPDYVIPFQTDKDSVIKNFKKMLRGRFFIPKSIRKIENIGNIIGLYLPYWSYDFEVNGDILFEANNVEYWKDANFKYKKVDSYLIKKNGHFDFKEVILQACSNEILKNRNLLEPFDYSGLVPFVSSYLSNYCSVFCDINDVTVLNKIRGSINSLSVKMIEDTIATKEKKIVENDMVVMTNNEKLMLLPVWLISFKYKDVDYSFFMNGQTGKFVGEKFPVGIREIVILSIVVFCLLFLIGFCFVLFFM